MLLEFGNTCFYPPALFRRRLFIGRTNYSMTKSREEGERDLQRLAITGRVEGCWHYIEPDGTWWHTPTETVERREDGKLISLMIRPPVLVPWSDQVITHYHTHPVIPFLEQEIAALGPNPNREALELERDLQLLHSQLPSSEDYRFAARVKDNNKSNIVSQLGVTEIRLGQDLDPDIIYGIARIVNRFDLRKAAECIISEHGLTDEVIQATFSIYDALLEPFASVSFRPL